MSEPAAHASKTTVARPRAIHRERFKVVSAIEGLCLSDRMTALFDKLDRENASPEQRRAAIRAMMKN
jgi:hypothetical protein